MSYNDAKPEHRNALAQIDESRQRALRAVSEVRKCQINSPHPNLAPAPEDGKSLPVIATQAVADYLVQLRPYRANSQKWHLDFGTVELPKSLDRGPSKRLGEKRLADLWICQQPEIELNNVSQLIESLNMDVHYSTNKPHRAGSSSDSRLKPSEMTAGVRQFQNQLPTGKVTEVSYRIDPPSYPGKFNVDSETFQSIRNGAITQDEAVEMDMTLEAEQDDEDDEDEYIPALPHVDDTVGDTRGRSGELRTYKFVFGPNRLLRLVEMADEVAAEMDLLIDLGTPREQDTGGI